MSMFSTASSNRQSGSATVAWNGYRLTTSSSMVGMPAFFSAAMCAESSRRASNPPCIFGCSVLTRPSSISGKPVCAETSVTAMPSLARSWAVPPVEMIWMPSAASARAKSMTPDFSETLIRARWIFPTNEAVNP